MSKPTVAQPVVPGLWQVTLDFVNVFLVDSGDGLTLVDTGIPGSAGRIVEALGSIGRSPKDIREVVVTHCHYDHSGSLAELKRLTGGTAIMHPVDAAMVRRGETRRPVGPGPGLVNVLVRRFFLPKNPPPIEAVDVDHEILDGEVLGSGLRAIHAPGHCAGQVALFWPENGGVLFAADAAVDVFGLGFSPIYEDLAEGRRTLANLARLDFEVAVFGHGKPILPEASRKFRARFAKDR